MFKMSDVTDLMMTIDHRMITLCVLDIECRIFIYSFDRSIDLSIERALVYLFTYFISMLFRTFSAAYKQNHFVHIENHMIQNEF